MSASLAEHEAIHDTVHNLKRSATADGIAVDRLRSLVDRIERMKEEVKNLNSDISDIFKEAKGAGFSVPALRRLISDRSKEAAEVEEVETMLDLYRRALGM